MAAPKALKPLHREPTPEEAEAIAQARAARAVRPRRSRPPKIGVNYKGPNEVAVDAPHSDFQGWADQLCESLGVDSWHVALKLAGDLDNVNPSRVVENQADADAYAARQLEALRFASALVNSGDTGAIEAALAAQMVAAHNASMKLSLHMQSASDRRALADYSRLMNQSMRTFAAQAEAMQKLRTGGKQQVEVRYVYVDARTQTVVSGAGGDGGADTESPTNLMHPTRVARAAPADGAPMWGQDPCWGTLHVSGDPGKATLPDARRQESRRPDGSEERSLSSRALHSTEQGRAEGAA